MIYPEKETEWNFLSLGAGVQSSTLALMAARGRITPMPDAAIFADTKVEPSSVYQWLDYLEPLLPFPVLRVSAGNLADDSLTPRITKDGRPYTKTIMPFFTKNKDGSIGMIRNRACTVDYKIKPIRKKVKELAKIKRGQKSLTVTQWIGISLDEIQRMKLSRDAWQQNRWPLIEQRMNRADCLSWMKEYGYRIPPRSACVHCPYHSDHEWRKLKLEEPMEFQKAVSFEKALQNSKAKTLNLSGTPFLHSSAKPLDQIDFSTDLDKGQMALWQDFNIECDGMCGL